MRGYLCCTLCREWYFPNMASLLKRLQGPLPHPDPFERAPPPPLACTGLQLNVPAPTYLARPRAVARPACPGNGDALGRHPNVKRQTSNTTTSLTVAAHVPP